MNSLIRIYQGNPGAGKTQKIIELCKNDGILIVFSSSEKDRIRKSFPNIKVFTFLDLVNGKCIGLRGDFYFDNLDLCLNTIFGNKPFAFGIDGVPIRLGAGTIKQAGESFFIDSGKINRAAAALDISAAKNFYIVSPSDAESSRLMSAKVLGTHHPITYDEFLSKAFHAPGIKGFYLHETHLFLKSIARHNSIKAVTIAC
jgi:hypothetical protein